MKPLKNIPVNTVFAEHYGCSAHQVAFYQVVHSTTHFVDVRRIKGTVDEIIDDGNDHTLKPVLNDFMEDESHRYKVKNWTRTISNPMPCIETGYMPAFMI